MLMRGFTTAGTATRTALFLLITSLWLRPSALPLAAQEPPTRFERPGKGPSFPTTAPPPLNSQAAAASFPLSDVFRIGYLAEGSDLSPARPLLQDLRTALFANEPVSRELKALGYQDISLRPCDEPADMIQRLDAVEFELAFATSIVYARQFKRVQGGADAFKAVPYEPILQFKRPGDINNTRGEVMREGSVFVGRGSALYGKRPTDEEIRNFISRGGLAVSDSNSAAGYIYTQIKMAERFNQLRPESFIFSGNSSEAVKYVLSGLVEAGACETQVLKSVGTVKTDRGEQQLYQVLFTTDAIPTDPILMRIDLLPKNSVSKLGTEIKVAIRSFFNDRQLARAPGLKVVNAVPASYEPVARALESFDAIKKPGQSAPVVAAPVPPTSPGDSATSAPAVAAPAATPTREQRPVLPPESTSGATKPRGKK